MEGRLTGTIWQRWSEGLCSLVAMHAGRFRNCVCTDRNRIGGVRKKWGSQRLRATLRREVHASHQILEARVGARGLFQLCVFRLGFLQHGNTRVGVFPDCEEVLIGGAGFGEGVRLWHGRPARGVVALSHGRDGRATCAGFERVGVTKESESCTPSAIHFRALTGSADSCILTPGGCAIHRTRFRLGFLSTLPVGRQVLTLDFRLVVYRAEFRISSASLLPTD